MFRCSKCDLCCKDILHLGIEEAKELDRGYGVCYFLDEETNLCDIYEDRPIFCRVEDLYN